LNAEAATTIAPNADLAAATASRADAPAGESPLVQPVALELSKTALSQIVLIVLGTMAFFYFTRPVLLPIFLACVAGMALKPLIRWSSCCRIPPPLSAALVLFFLVAGIIVGFIQFGRPAMKWVDDAPQHMAELRQRIQKILPPGERFTEAAAAVNNLGATEAEKMRSRKKLPQFRSKRLMAPVQSSTGPELCWLALVRHWCGFTCCWPPAICFCKN
jgi:hypothetical protein